MGSWRCIHTYKSDDDRRTTSDRLRFVPALLFVHEQAELEDTRGAAEVIGVKLMQRDTVCRHIAETRRPDPVQIRPSDLCKSPGDSPLRLLCRTVTLTLRPDKFSTKRANELPRI